MKILLIALTIIGLKVMLVDFLPFIPRKGDCITYGDPLGYKHYKLTVPYVISSVKIDKIEMLKYQTVIPDQIDEQITYHVSWIDYFRYEDYNNKTLCPPVAHFAPKKLSTNLPIKVAVMDGETLKFTEITKPKTLENDLIKLFRVPNEVNNEFETLNYHADTVASLIFNFKSSNQRIENFDYNISLVNYDVYPFGKVFTHQAVLSAYQSAIKDKVKIINYSSGGPYSPKEEMVFLKKLEKKGIIVVVSAGNESGNANDYYPCKYALELSNVICVGALSAKTNDTITLSRMTNLSNNLVYALSHNGSTSFAAPKVSRMLALIWSNHPDYNYQEVIKNLPLKSYNAINSSHKVLDEDLYFNHNL